ncbi:Hypothetical predicted protein, partial [Olea europaea subsp. europaea]
MSDKCWFGYRFCGICNGVGPIVWDADNLRVASSSRSKFWSRVREIRAEEMIYLWLTE